VPNIALAPEAVPSKAVVGALGCIAAVAPALPILSEPEDSDADYQFRFESDPFCYAGALRAGWCNELRLLYDRFQAAGSLESVELPFIVFQSTRDDFCNPEGSYALFERARSRDRTLVEVTNMGHAVITEEGCEEVIAQILEWILPRARAGEGDTAFDCVAVRRQLTVAKKAPALSFAGAAAAVRFAGRTAAAAKDRKVHLSAGEARQQSLWLLRG